MLVKVLTPTFTKAFVNGGGELGSLIIDKIKVTEGINHDVAIDLSCPIGLTNLMQTIKPIPLVVGTPGALPYKDIKYYAQTAPVTLCTNFSQGSTILEAVTRRALERTQGWNKNILNIMPGDSKSFPSETSKNIARIMNTDYNSIVNIKLGEDIEGHSVILSTKGEIIEIKHSIINKDILAQGAVDLAKWTINKNPGIYYK